MFSLGAKDFLTKNFIYIRLSVQGYSKEWTPIYATKPEKN